MIRTRDGWINIEDALPPVQKDVLVAFNHHGINCIGIGCMGVYDEADYNVAEPRYPYLTMLIAYPMNDYKIRIEVPSPVFEGNEAGDEIIAWKELPEYPEF